MNDNIHTPLKNKKWLFPETGRAGFHYDDINNAVTGLKKDLRESYRDLYEEELLALVEKWFPDVTEREQFSWMRQPRTQRKTMTYDEKQLEIVLHE
jgi:hypothetical protein